MEDVVGGVLTLHRKHSTVLMEHPDTYSYPS